MGKALLMPIELTELLEPARTALVISECQRGVIGDLARLPDLGDAAGYGAEEGVVANVAALARLARDCGVQVIHGTAIRRADGRGANTNARLFAAMAKLDPMLPGSPDAEVVPEIGVDERDIELPRLHGLNPMHGTELDAVLRNLGITTIVVAGVSVNIALTNLVFDAVNLGYRVVVPRDAVAGVPAEYADAVIDNSLSLCAAITTSDEVGNAWQ